VFRAVRIAEATDTLRRTYESRLQSVRKTLETIEPANLDDASEVDHEIWTLSGRQAISVRTKQLLSEADTEISLLVDTAVVDAELAEALQEATSRGVRVVVGLVGDSDEFDFDLPNVEFVDPTQEFLTCLGFLTPSLTTEVESPSAESETPISLSRLLLIDRQTVVLGTNTEATRATVDEQSVCAIGETNGLVVLARRLLAPDCFSAIDDA
jgi:sugar-specific transcriptional regulator TrmB